MWPGIMHRRNDGKAPELQSFDLLIRGGRLFHPETRSFTKADVAVSDGKILRMAPSLPGTQARKVIDAAGCIVSPGLIDFHVHCFKLVHRISIDPDELAPRSGTAVMVDAGSSGALNFDAFREYVLTRSKLRLFAFLNISLMGQCFEAQIPGVPVIHEYDDPRLVHVDQAVRCIEENRDYIVGIKVRAYHGLSNLTPILAALEAADKAGVPVMVHTASPPPSTRRYFHRLRPGDVVTHLYHPEPHAVVDKRGRIRVEYRAARERGVLMETGFARWHTDFKIMKKTADAGFWPDIIGTDVTTTNINELVFDLLSSASKLLAAGMPLEDLLAAVTINPAGAIGRPGLAELKEGGPADLAVLELRKESVTFKDYYGHSLEGKERLVCRSLLINGQQVG